MAFSSIPPLPTPPTLADPASFNNRAEAFVGALPATMAGINTFAVELNQLQLGDMSSYVYTFFQADTAQQARASLGMDYATQAEAEAGTSTTKTMSPLRGMQQIAKWFTGKIATSSAAAAATANDVIMTPLRVQDWFGGQRPTAAEAAAGTSAVKIMTPAATEQHMVANALGWGQVRTALTSSQRPSGTVQTNDTGRPIEITVSIEGGGGGCRIETSADGTTFAVAARGININGEERLFASVTVPAGHRYRPNYGTFYSWSELR